MEIVSLTFNSLTLAFQWKKNINDMSFYIVQNIDVAGYIEQISGQSGLVFYKETNVHMCD